MGWGSWVFSIHYGMLMGPFSCRSHADKYSCCEFMGTIAVSYQDDRLHSTSSPSLSGFYILPWGSLNLGGGGANIPLKVENSTITVLNTLTVMYGHNYIYLRVVWCHKTGPSSKTTVVTSFLGTMSCSLVSFDQVYNTQGRVPSCGMGIKSNQKLVFYPVNRHVMIALVGTSCLTIQLYNTQVPNWVTLLIPFLTQQPT